MVLGLKFGSEPDETMRLIQLTKDLGLDLHGFSFHVGSPCGEMDAYRRGIEMCRELITVAKEIGFDVRLIDIGGGFPGETGISTDEVCVQSVSRIVYLLRFKRYGKALSGIFTS